MTPKPGTKKPQADQAGSPRPKPTAPDGLDAKASAAKDVNLVPRKLTRKEKIEKNFSLLDPAVADLLRGRVIPRDERGSVTEALLLRHYPALQTCPPDHALDEVEAGKMSREDFEAHIEIMKAMEDEPCVLFSPTKGLWIDANKWGGTLESAYQSPWRQAKLKWIMPSEAILVPKRDVVRS
jgi:hypothetical protein